MQRFDIHSGNARLSINFGSSSRLTNLGPGTVSYADSDEDTAQGTLAPAATVNLSETRYLWADATATVRVEDLTVGTDAQRLEAVEERADALESDRTAHATRLTVIEETINADSAAYTGDVQAAINAAATASKGRVYLPAKVRNIPAAGWDVSAVQDELIIFGEGKRSELRMPATAGLIGIDIAGEKVSLRDLFIKGSSAGGTGTESHAVRFQATAHYGRCIDVWVQDAGDDGIHVVAGALSGEVVRPHIIDSGGNGITVSSDANAWRVQGGWVQSNAGNGIYSGRNELLHVEGVALEVNGTNGGGFGNLHMFESKYPVVRANYFEDGQDYDIRYNDTAGFAVEGSICENVFQAFGGTPSDVNVFLEAAYRTFMEGNKFSSACTGVNLQCGINTFGLRLGVHHWPGSRVFAHANNTGAGGYAHGLALSVASAATMDLPGSSVVIVTGTTTITTINANSPGTTKTLIFPDALTVTDGSNLALNGNFVTTGNDTLTLVCDGSAWYEVARSVN